MKKSLHYKKKIMSSSLGH